jgi:hypothetical protein
VALTTSYVIPATGTLLVTPAQATNFVSGIATVSCRYDDCGTITITATDSVNPQKTGTSSNIFFKPFSLTAQADSSVQTVSKAFTLTVTTLNAQGQITPNYAGPANITFSYVSPAVSQNGTLTPASITTFTGGTATIQNMLYNKWGKINIAVSDSNDPLKTGQTGEIMFMPQDFFISLSTPPVQRDFYYINEEFQATVTARDATQDRITNYQGSIAFTQVPNLSTQAPYTFTVADAGMHTFDFVGSEELNFNITVNDTAFTQITGTSETSSVKYGKIVVLNSQGTVGEVSTTVQLIDASGAIIRNDSSTTFLVTLTEGVPNNTASCPAVTTPVTMNQGIATISVLDPEPETVTITPASTPVLDAGPGSITFGAIGSKGIRILFWKEQK